MTESRGKSADGRCPSAHLHLLVDAVVEKQVMGHAHAMGLHRVTLQIGKGRRGILKGRGGGGRIREGETAARKTSKNIYKIPSCAQKRIELGWGLQLCSICVRLCVRARVRVFSTRAGATCCLSPVRSKSCRHRGRKSRRSSACPPSYFHKGGVTLVPPGWG